MNQYINHIGKDGVRF